MSDLWYDDFRSRFPRTRPRRVQGGIRAQSRRGTFGQSWWAKRWISVLESFEIGGRLSRGRSYARNGQVVAIDIDKGTVKAKVQGSRPTPYDVAIHMNVLSEPQWRQVTRALAGQAVYAAKLLAGEMPQDIEKVFQKVGLSLFPDELDDLRTKCSCPDWSNPCKHIAAVYYLIGEEFDRDPFLLFKIRGLSREELFELLKTDDTKPVPQRKRKAGGPKRKAAKKAKESEPLPAAAAKFWAAPGLPDNWLGEVHAPPVPAPLLKRLGSFPFWRGQERFLDALEPVYGAAGQRGLDLLAGGQDDAADKSPPLKREPR